MPLEVEQVWGGGNEFIVSYTVLQTRCMWDTHVGVLSKQVDVQDWSSDVKMGYKNLGITGMQIMFERNDTIWQTNIEWEEKRVLSLTSSWSRGGWSPKGDWEETGTNVGEKSDKGGVPKAVGRGIFKKWLRKLCIFLATWVVLSDLSESSFRWMVMEAEPDGSGLKGELEETKQKQHK